MKFDASQENTSPPYCWWVEVGKSGACEKHFTRDANANLCGGKKSESATVLGAVHQTDPAPTVHSSTPDENKTATKPTDVEPPLDTESSTSEVPSVVQESEPTDDFISEGTISSGEPVPSPEEVYEAAVREVLKDLFAPEEKKTLNKLKAQLNLNVLTAKAIFERVLKETQDAQTVRDPKSPSMAI